MDEWSFGEYFHDEVNGGHHHGHLKFYVGSGTVSTGLPLHEPNKDPKSPQWTHKER